MTLTEFLLARIAEDEEEANALPDWRELPLAPLARLSPFPPMTPWERNRIEASGEYAHCTISKARVLAECEAKRQAIEAAWMDHSQIEGEWGTGKSREQMEAANDYPEVIQCLALPYADHADCRQEWAL